MIDMHSKYDNMYKNVIFYALICINNHIIACVSCMLSRSEERERTGGIHVLSSLIS